MNELEQHKASPEMKLFFERLLALKYHIKNVADLTNNPEIADIYEQLDAIIKEGK